MFSFRSDAVRIEVTDRLEALSHVTGWKHYPTFTSGFDVLKFLRDRWFLILLLVVLATGIAYGTRLKTYNDHKAVRDAVVATTLFLMALPLEAKAIWGTIRRPLASLVALLVTYVLLPLTAWGASLALSGGLAPGLLIAAATPCTIASAAVWTRRAGGNDAVATMVTVLTNLLCFVAMPTWLSIMMGHGIQSDEFVFSKAVVQLGKLVVVPMLIAQLVRLHRPLAAWATKHKLGLSMLAQCGIIYMVFAGAVQTGIQVFSATGKPPALFDFLLMVAAVLGVHLSAFWYGLRLGKLAGLSREDQIAVAFSGSQKTLMIGLKVSLDYGVSILPMVTFHIGQLLVDTVIADRMAREQPVKQL